MNIDQEHSHIVSFINGFESIVKQHQLKHYVDVGGVESYTIGVMRAEGESVDLVIGTENFISNGIKKLWEMVSNFSKSVWAYFFGSEKKAETAVKETEEIKKVSAGVKTAVNSSKVLALPAPSAPPAPPAVPHSPPRYDPPPVFAPPAAGFRQTPQSDSSIVTLGWATV